MAINATQNTAIAAIQAAERNKAQEHADPALEAKRFTAIEAIKRDIAALIDNREAGGSRVMQLLRSVVHAIASGGVIPFSHRVDPQSEAFKQWTADNMAAVLPVVESEGGNAINHPRIAATNAVKQSVRRCFVIAAWLHSHKITSLALVGNPANRARLPLAVFAGLAKEKVARFVIEGDDTTLPLTFEGIDKACAAALSREGLRADAAVTQLTKATKLVSNLWKPTKASNGTYAITPVSPKLAKAVDNLLTALLGAKQRKATAPAKRKASKAKVLKMAKAAKAEEVKAS